MKLVVNLGMSRTGSHFMTRLLEAGTGYFCFKLCEPDLPHPINGLGLLDYLGTFRNRELVVVHTTRDREEVWASIRHAQKEAPGFMGRFVRRSHFDTLYDRELANFEAFAERAHELEEKRVKCSVVSIAYEDLDVPVKRHEWLIELDSLLPGNLERWRRFFDRMWMKKPVGMGRLEAGVR